MLAFASPQPKFLGGTRPPRPPYNRRPWLTVTSRWGLSLTSQKLVSLYCCQDQLSSRWCSFSPSPGLTMVTASIMSYDLSWFQTGLQGSAASYFINKLLEVAHVKACQRLYSSLSSSLVVSHTRLSTVGDKAFPVTAACVWNSLPKHVPLHFCGLFSSDISKPACLTFHM